MRWRITDPQNRIRRLEPVANGTVSVELTLESDDPATIAAVEQAASDAGIEIVQVEAAPMAARSLPVHEVTINGIEFRPFRPI